MSKAGYLVVGSFWVVLQWAVLQSCSRAVGQSAVLQSCSRAVGQWAVLQWGSLAVGQWAVGESREHLHTLPGSCRGFTTDKLQNVYTIDSNNRVHKYGPDGKEQFHYNNNTRGVLQYIDPTDPFNLLLFYPELQVITTLDRTMNETAVLELFTVGVFNATAIGLATDNNIWVYDQAAFRLKKIGQSGEVLAQSDNLSALLKVPPVATQILAHNNIVYLNCPGQGIYVFDNFAQYHQLLPYSAIETLQIQDSKLVLYESQQVRAYNPETLQDQVLMADTTGAAQTRLQGNRIYQRSQQGVVKVFVQTP